MKMNGDRLFAYFTGVILGLVMVSFIMSRRAAKEEAGADPWIEHNVAMVEAGADPLPETVPASLAKGRILDFGYLPEREGAAERVWLLRFKESYPNVRLVEHLETRALSIMAADQVKVILREGQDVTGLTPMLDALGLRLRMFNREEKLAVVGVLNTGIAAVPETLEAIQRWSALFASAEPDAIVFKDQRGE